MGGESCGWQGSRTNGDQGRDRQALVVSGQLHRLFSPSALAPSHAVVDGAEAKVGQYLRSTAFVLAVDQALHCLRLRIS
jgi:hypothetical protein